MTYYYYSRHTLLLSRDTDFGLPWRKSMSRMDSKRLTSPALLQFIFMFANNHYQGRISDRFIQFITLNTNRWIVVYLVCCTVQYVRTFTTSTQTQNVYVLIKTFVICKLKYVSWLLNYNYLITEIFLTWILRIRELIVLMLCLCGDGLRPWSVTPSIHPVRVGSTKSRQREQTLHDRLYRWRSGLSDRYIALYCAKCYVFKSQTE